VPDRVDFCFVAEPVARRRLLLFDSAVTEQKRATLSGERPRTVPSKS
jgi:hypothetical protein